jgi:hypothetical protein
MNRTIFLRILLLGWILSVPRLLTAQDFTTPKSASTGGRVIFETGFERFEGYDPALDLVDALGRGQNGWMAVGQGGNGLLTNLMDGFTGQYAYVGYQGPTNSSSSVNLFRPFQLIPNWILAR